MPKCFVYCQIFNYPSGTNELLLPFSKALILNVQLPFQDFYPSILLDSLINISKIEPVALPAKHTHTHNLLYYHRYVYFQRRKSTSCLSSPNFWQLSLTPFSPDISIQKLTISYPLYSMAIFPSLHFHSQTQRSHHQLLPELLQQLCFDCCPALPPLTYSSQRSHHSFKAYFIVMILM